MVTEQVIDNAVMMGEVKTMYYLVHMCMSFLVTVPTLD
jgi:hypothetical protein